MCYRIRHFPIPDHALSVEAELDFRNLGTLMVPTLGSHVAAQQWKDVSQKRSGLARLFDHFEKYLLPEVRVLIRKDGM